MFPELPDKGSAGVLAARDDARVIGYRKVGLAKYLAILLNNFDFFDDAVQKND